MQYLDTHRLELPDTTHDKVVAFGERADVVFRRELPDADGGKSKWFRSDVPIWYGGDYGIYEITYDVICVICDVVCDVM